MKLDVGIYLGRNSWGSGTESKFFGSAVLMKGTTTIGYLAMVFIIIPYIGYSLSHKHLNARLPPGPKYFRYHWGRKTSGRE